ncbi:MAG: hypothetical protein ACFCU2_07785 [Acidimicrobiia bacterium]
MTLGFGSDLVAIDLSTDYGVDSLYAPRRTVLDPILVGAAVVAGVDYMERCRAKSLVKDSDGTVRGVVLDAGSGEVLLPGDRDPRGLLSVHTRRKCRFDTDQ